MIDLSSRPILGHDIVICTFAHYPHITEVENKQNFMYNDTKFVIKAQDAVTGSVR